MNADLIISAQAIINPLAKETSETTVAINGGIISAVGGPELRAQAGESTRVIELDGVILPGLVDIHTHPIWGSIERGTSLDLAGVKTREQLVSTTAARISQLAGAEWITGFNLDLNVFGSEVDGRFFEEHFPGIKISYLTADAHALVISPAVVAQLGLTGTEEFADASQIVVDRTGAPTGYVLELQAMDLVVSHYPVPSIAQAANYVLAELRTLAASGLTGVHALDFADPSQEVYEYLDERNLLPLFVHASPLIPADSTPQIWQQALEQQKLGGTRWKVSGVKFMLDGTADNGSAWFQSSDCLGENAHSLWRNPQAYAQAVAFFTAHGVPTATHAIGDAAVAFALDAIEAAGPASGGAHRIEHLESIGDELLDRFAQLNVVASVQPVHGTRLISPHGDDNWSTRLGAERARHGWRTRDLLDAGAPLALGSDWPIGVADPRVALADAQLRRPVEETGRAALHTEQAISSAEAYYAMTRIPALVTGNPAGGRVATGSPANLSIFANNPLSLTPEEQAANPVLATVVTGQLYHYPA